MFKSNPNHLSLFTKEAFRRLKFKELCDKDYKVINGIGKIVDYFDSKRMTRKSSSLINLMSRQNYAHGLKWFNVPIFQTPTDLYLYQEILYKVKPNIVIETGVAKGGSILYASNILELLHGQNSNCQWRVICCDINSLDQAKYEIEKAGYGDRVSFFHGDSASTEFRHFAKAIVDTISKPKILLALDSNHTEEHVLAELRSLADLVSVDSYAIVWDSRIGDLSKLTHFIRPRAWNKHRHAGTGAISFMKKFGFAKGFVFDKTYENRLKLTGVKNGILLRTRYELKSNDKH